jgi:archaellum biogenesis ATPase FlaH
MEKKGIALIRKGEVDLNKQLGTIYNPNILVKETLYLPPSILELGMIVRGEAGGGKTVFLDRMMLETLEAGHSVIVHNVKGDELKKISGYKSFYHIEPWTANTYEIDFLNLCADKRREAEDTKIRTLVEAFSKISDDFFVVSSLTVVEALVRSAIRKNKNAIGKVTKQLEEVVKTWHSFNVDETVTMVDMTDIKAVKKAVQQESQQLKKISDFLGEFYPTARMYVDPKNEKTSLCVLASVVEIIRKFETISNFWKTNAVAKDGTRNIFDIQKWIGQKQDRKVIILSNSNMFSDVANSYISAFINLVTSQLIDSKYEPVKEIHFILDEFVQLSSINLDTFLKLPDVGRGKDIRVKIAYQRSSQVTATWPKVDGKSFASAFQNKIWARFADDDKDNIRHELGRQKTRTIKNNDNWSAQGQSVGIQREDKVDDVTNIDELWKDLSPVVMIKDGQEKVVGVTIICNFSNVKAVPIIKIPFVNFPKRKQEIVIKSGASGGNKKESSNNDEDNKEELAREILNNIKNSVELVPNQPTIEQVTEATEEKYFGKSEGLEEKSIGESVVSDFSAEAIDHTGILSTALKVAEVIEGMENHTQNTNTQSSNSVSDNELEEFLNSMKDELKNKNKEKTK